MTSKILFESDKHSFLEEEIDDYAQECTLDTYEYIDTKKKDQ